MDTFLHHHRYCMNIKKYLPPDWILAILGLFCACTCLCYGQKLAPEYNIYPFLGKMQVPILVFFVFSWMSVCCVFLASFLTQYEDWRKR